MQVFDVTHFQNERRHWTISKLLIFEVIEFEVVNFRSDPDRSDLFLKWSLPNIIIT